jgi:hypothetical protein
LPFSVRLPFTWDVPKPPAPTPPPPAGLAEVERALSVLEGRHPEHERIRRETVAAAEQRGHALAKDRAVRARRRRRRAAAIACTVIALTTAGRVGWWIVRRARVIRASLEREEAPLVSRGATEIASNELSARNTLEVDLPGPSCLVAVSTAGAVRVQRGGTSLQASPSVGWCSCAPGHVTLEASGERPGLGLLRLDARDFGGPLARPWAQATPSVWGTGGGECAEAMLDDWLAARRGPRPTFDAHWLEARPERASLARAGFRPVSDVEPGRPFGVVDSAADQCTLAVGRAEDELSLRVRGGERPVAHAHGAMAWCGRAAETTTVWREGWREGASSVIVLSAPAGRVGGLLGARECADLGGVHVSPDATWLRDEDLAWDATSLMQVSALAEITSAPLPIEPGAAAWDVTALARSAGARVAWAPSGVVIACDPPLLAPSPERTSMCATAGPVSWWRRTEAPASLGHAPLPFWLSLFESHHEPDAIARIPALLALARRLAREGFEPTVLEGVTELADGVRVVGRAGEDQVVAVGLGPKAPWAFPYARGGVAWHLGDPPRVVSLQPGVALKLVASPPPDAPLEKRRTIVFRHAVRP